MFKYAVVDSTHLLLKQLELQKEISKNHQEEIKFWKEQTEALNIEVKQLRLGEEVYAKEKSELVKSLDEIEAQLKVAKLEADENVKLKEQLTRAAADELVTAELRKELADVQNKLTVSENQRSELEFVYQETVAKLEEKQKETASGGGGGEASRQAVSELEFALEEQKVLVQELEAKLAAAKSEEAERLRELEDRCTSMDAIRVSLENELKRSRESSSEQNVTSQKLIEEKSAVVERLSEELSALKEAKNKEAAEHSEANASLTSSMKLVQDKFAASEQQLDEARKLNGELQVRINELIQNSGDNSAQLNSLNENLQLKEKYYTHLFTVNWIHEIGFCLFHESRQTYV